MPTDDTSKPMNFSDKIEKLRELEVKTIEANQVQQFLVMEYEKSLKEFFGIEYLGKKMTVLDHINLINFVIDQRQSGISEKNSRLAKNECS